MDRVRIVPIVLRPGGGSFQGYLALELPRLPQARELLELQPTLPESASDMLAGGMFRVQLVRMTPQSPGGTHADVYLSPALLGDREPLLAQEDEEHG